eukprot:scaffold44642_cov37-Prasinocladus_malaysianus.AAC.1
MSDATKAARKRESVPDVGAMSEKDAALRLQLIEGYRQSRRAEAGAGNTDKAKRGPATLQSLKDLVRASAAGSDDK